ncbi:MAG TPA: glycosyltransferase family 4 protein [Thermoleophilaceae bacterium]|nr:glycosyltransferase family 4 protein [Thermoleophilaceae bacterium]
MPAPDLALVSLGTTPGLRRADAAFAEMAREAGADCELVPVRIGRGAVLRRHPALTDLVESLYARRSARGGARATVYSTVTAALLQPERPGRVAVRFDSAASLNRPGIAGAWQRRVERRVLARADLLLPWSDAARLASPGGAPSVVLPVPVEEIGGGEERDVDGLAYCGYPEKRGLDILCAAWGDSGGRLVIGGIDAERGREWLARRGVAEPPGTEWLGALPRAQWLDWVTRARVFINASRREDHGLAQLEALAAGCALVTVPSPGPYAALALARELNSILVAADVSAGALGGSIRSGLALGRAELAAYRERALGLIAPHRPDAVRATMRDEVLPRLLG